MKKAELKKLKKPELIDYIIVLEKAIERREKKAKDILKNENRELKRKLTETLAVIEMKNRRIEKLVKENERVKGLILENELLKKIIKKLEVEEI